MKSKGGENIAHELVQLDEKFKIYEARLGVLIEDLIDEAPFVNDLRDAISYIANRPNKLLDLNLAWLDDFINNLNNLADWNAAEIEKFLREFMKERKLKGREFFHPVRVILTGLEKGAALPLIMYALGRDECAARLKGAMN